MVAIAVAAALVAAACGGDGDDDTLAEPASAPAVDAAGDQGEGAAEPDDPAQPASTPPEGAEPTRALFAGIADDEPGCSVAVNVDDEIVFAEAYGAASLDPPEPFTTSTVVDIASTSKQFTAIAVGSLIVDGEVASDDPVAEWVDDLPDWAEEVTVAQLVNHTSGIPDYIDLLNDAGIDLADPSDQADALDAIAAEELDAEPGTVFEYSNSNYVLMAEVVAAAYGDDLPTWLEQELFGPLGIDAEMTPALDLPGKAVSYWFEGDWEVADSPWTQLGDGAVQTTPSELASFATTYWLSGDPWDDLAALRTELGVDTGEGVYSLGIETFEIDGATYLSHSGSWGGFETTFVVATDDRVAVALTCNSPDVEVDFAGLEERLLDIWLP
ncbi:MAG: serine hydrolase domain-containing protein [Acidimicrobiales bacterium]